MPKRKRNAPQLRYNDDSSTSNDAEKVAKVIGIKEEPLDHLEAVKSKPAEESFPTRTRTKRKSALKAHENIANCFSDEETEPTSVPRVRRHKHKSSIQSFQEDQPDLIDISKLCNIKQEEEYEELENVNSSIEADDSNVNKGNTEEMLNLSAEDFLETDNEEKDSIMNFVPADKIFLKTDEILGVRTLKRPTKGPQKIVGCVDTKDSEFKIKCDHCEERFTTKFSFNRHLKKVHNIDNEQCVLQCKYCTQKSKTTYNLKLHMLMNHLDELNLKTKWYRCSKCNLTSTESEEIHNHKEESIWCQGAFVLVFHTCMECPFQTDRVSKLQGHVKWHYRSGGLKCPHCTLKCSPSYQKMMNEHLLLHKTVNKT